LALSAALVLNLPYYAFSSLQQGLVLGEHGHPDAHTISIFSFLALVYLLTP